MNQLLYISSIMMGWASRLNDDINKYNAHKGVNPTHMLKVFIETDIRNLREAIDLIEEEIPDLEQEQEP
jgi:hypothetical protein